MAWDTETETRLLLAMIEVTGVTLTRVQWKEVSDLMGGGFSVEAVRQKYPNIKKKLSSNNGSTTKATATPKSAKSTGRKKKGQENSNDDGDTNKTPRASPRKRGAQDYTEPATNDEEVPESPKKKLKQEKIEKSFFDQDEESV